MQCEKQVRWRGARVLDNLFESFLCEEVREVGAPCPLAAGAAVAAAGVMVRVVGVVGAVA